ncbi:MAG: hypothetical protein MZV65_40760 [Chromatiales bacterium]|nr:hypothetical protein [Chromatiales bacterium]
MEYEVGRRIEEVVTAPGGIRRLSVGVLVPKPMTEEQLAHLRSLISMTAGLSEERGDAIAVHSIDQLMQSDIAVRPTRRAPRCRPATSPTGTRRPRALEALGDAGGQRRRRHARAAGGTVARAGRRRAQRARALHQKMAQEQRESLFAEMKRWIEAENSRPVEEPKG